MEDRSELHSVRKFTNRSELEKALNTLEGILLGISIDQKISSQEIAALNSWCNTHYAFVGQPVVAELVEAVRQAIHDGVVTAEERENIIWFANQVRGNSIYWNVVSAELQILQGIMHGVLSDGAIEAEELKNLQKWIFENEQLTGSYPYDELSSLLVSVLKDGKVDSDELKVLKVFFSEFVDTSSISALDLEELAKLKSEVQIAGICSLDPEVSFRGNTFCFTGISSRAKRSDIAKIIENKSGIFNNNIVKATKYLVYGDETNPVWAYSCYGRKVEQALAMRKSGSDIKIVHEADFWDAVEN